MQPEQSAAAHRQPGGTSNAGPDSGPDNASSGAPRCRIAQTPVALTAALDELAAQVAQLHPSEHGLSYFDLPAAHAQAAQVRWDDPAHDLAGWIIPAKDLVDVAGMPTTFGNARRTRLATSTHPIVQSYLQRGAIVPGKTATCEFGMTAYTEPVDLPAPHNPLFAEPRTPGGSSGGAAVLVARGLVPAAQASDGGGSIRIPAAATGLVGLKPAHNTAGGNCIAQGYLTADLHQLLQLHRLQPQLRPLRIGVFLEGLHAPIPENADADCFEVVEEAATACARQGHEVVRLSRPYGPEVFAAFQDAMAKRATKIPGPSSAMVTWLRECGRQLSSADYAHALQVMGTTRARLLYAWDVDVILTPMLTFAPPAIGYFESLDPAENFYHQTQWTPWGAMYNMAGCAALSVPWEQGRARLTAGDYVPSIQLGALRGDAALLCGLALQLAGAQLPSRKTAAR